MRNTTTSSSCRLLGSSLESVRLAFASAALAQAAHRGRFHRNRPSKGILAQIMALALNSSRARHDMRLADMRWLDLRFDARLDLPRVSLHRRMLGAD